MPPKQSPRRTRHAGKHTLSAQLRDVIESRGLTSYALGRAAGVAPAVISRFVSGDRGLTMATADRVAEALGLRLVEVGSKGRVRPRSVSRGVGPAVEDVPIDRDDLVCPSTPPAPGGASVG
jgi:transcriptional regulator with XRE-family HTH domain